MKLLLERLSLRDRPLSWGMEKIINRKKVASLVLLTTILSVGHIQANDDDGKVEAFQARTEAQCQDIGVRNIVSWFKYEDSVSELNELIGEPRDQGQVGWCFAYTVRDMVHYESGIAVDPFIVTKNYYTGFVGSISGLFSKNEGGFNLSTLRGTLNKGACTETNINQVASPKNIKRVQCNDPLTDVSFIGSARRVSRTHMGRSHSLFAQLDELLMQDKMVAIGYGADGLYKRKHRKGGFFRKYSANHASTIVGRFFDKTAKSCRYIIRNSWGTRTNYALEGPQRAGYHSIKESELSKNMSEITWIEN